ncbi:phage head spike fiber domain-containing protein [Cupriavidus sp. 30B13]|uniref:phage head spike fiber domain-containing protein n=1 Tax=Cupriavidus sp. 30B13 TaxID=3384241 RepID=UPI003B920DC5
MLVSKNFGDIVTFMRASVGWSYSPAGVLVPSAANGPRLDYDPIAQLARGLLVEEQRTNLVSYSENFANAYWSKVSIAVAASASPGADGALSAFDITEANGASGSKELTAPSVSYTAGQTYTISAFFRTKAVGVVRRLRMAVSSGSVIAGSLAVAFDPSDGGSVAQVVNASNARLDVLPNGLLRGQWSFTAANTVSANLYLTLADSSNLTTYVGDGVSGITLFGVMIEQSGGFAGSYVKTGGAQVTRAPDAAVIADLSKIGFNATEGTIYAEVEAPNPSIATAKGIVSIDDGTENNRLTLTKEINGRLGFASVIGGAGSVILASAANMPAGPVKVAAAYKAGDFAMCMGGAAPVISAAGVLPAGLNAMRLGVRSNGGAINGWLRNVRYIPRRITNAELQALTT